MLAISTENPADRRHKPPFQFGLASLLILMAGIAAVSAKGDPKYLLMGASGIALGTGAFLLLALVIALPYVAWLAVSRWIHQFLQRTTISKPATPSADRHG